jgi:hypothetical protein
MTIQYGDFYSRDIIFWVFQEEINLIVKYVYQEIYYKQIVPGTIFTLLRTVSLCTARDE